MEKERINESLQLFLGELQARQMEILADGCLLDDGTEVEFAIFMQSDHVTARVDLTGVIDDETVTVTTHCQLFPTFYTSVEEVEEKIGQLLAELDEFFENRTNLMMEKLQKDPAVKLRRRIAELEHEVELLTMQQL